MKEFLIGYAVAALCLLAGFYAGSLQEPVQIGASTEHTKPEVFQNEVTLGNCGTASYTIPALSPALSAVGLGARYTTTSVTVTGSALGDMALVAVNSTTQPLAFYGVTARAEIVSANTAVVEFSNPTNVTSTAITTSTLKVCYFD